jgi:hypothetical protein
MAFQPCSLCGERKPGKQASAYWAWFLANGDRTAWKQRLDADCLVSTYSSLLQKCSSDSTEKPTCLGCGGSLGDDWDPVFLTLYLPKQDPKEYELPMCAPCAATQRVTMQVGAERLADRQVRGPSPSATGSDPFKDLPF